MFLMCGALGVKKPIYSVSVVLTFPKFSEYTQLFQFLPLLLILVLFFNKLSDDRTEGLVVGTRDEHLEIGGSLIPFQPQKERKKKRKRKKGKKKKKKKRRRSKDGF